MSRLAYVDVPGARALLTADAAEVSRHESGARCPSVPLLARYAEVLEVPIYELLRFDEPGLSLG